MRRRRLAFVCAIALSWGVAASAEAKEFTGAGQDAAGDQTAGNPGARDIRAVSARYDESAGTIETSVDLGAAPDAASDGVLVAFLREDCAGGSYALFVDNLVADPGDPGLWTTDADTSNQRPLTRGGSAATVTYAATDFNALAYEGYRCLVVRTSPGSGAPYDEAEVALAEDAPPAPAPTPTPAPSPSPSEPQPLGPAPLVRSERLAAALAACGARKACVRKARSRFAPTRRERLRTALDACGSRRCTARARSRFRGVRPAPKPTGLERSLYAYGASDILGQCGGICWEALAFVDRRFVHVGLPEGAGIPNCTRVTYDAKDEEGCARYRIRDRGRAVSVAGRTYRISKRGRALVRAASGDEDEPTTLARQVFPAAGARWNVPVIEAIAVNGSPFIGTQIITKTYLTLTRDGRFAKSSLFFGSSAPGVDPGITVSGTPPDQRGTYEVLPAGTIRLTYADGKTELGSAFFWDAAKGRDPNRAGLHVRDDTFFGPPDD